MNYLLLRLKRFCGFVVGFVFFIGGVLKLLDPVGAGLVMAEYFDFLHLGFLDGISKPAGVAFALVESITGVAMVTGVWRRATAVIAMIFQIFFTLLTLLLVIFNPEMDCGCFGEAIHLTHMQTFMKNIILCLLLAAYYFPPKALGFCKKHKYVSFAIVTASVIAFTAYSWMHIPLTDFTAYKPGADLSSGRDYDYEKVFDAVYIYEKDGVEEEFSLDALPDSTWTFVRTETSVTDNSALDGISLSFYDESGEYFDELAAEGKVMVISFYENAGPSKMERTAEFVQNASNAGFQPLVLTSGATDVWKEYGIHAYSADYKTLVSLNRSNGGATYFCDGMLIRKWSGASLPDENEMKKVIGNDDIEVMIDSNGHLAFQGFLLYVTAVMMLL